MQIRRFSNQPRPAMSHRPTRLVCLAFALAATTLGSGAQPSTPDQTPSRYPWDLRPRKCDRIPNATQYRMCQHVDWPTFSDAAQRMDSLLASSNFELIERAARELALSREKFPTGEYRFEAFSLAMRTVFTSTGEHGSGIARAWRAAKPDSDFSLLAAAMAKSGRAWSARGGGTANTVSAEAWAIFYGQLEEAVALLDAASEDFKTSGPWHIFRLELAYQIPRLEAERLHRLAAASEAWPESRFLYGVPMRFSHPKWGGSFALMDGVARLGAQRSASSLGSGMYALLYIRAFAGDPHYTLRDSKVDWALMKQGFRDLEQRSAGPVGDRLAFAAMACQMHDKTEAQRLYKAHDKLAGAAGAEAATDACRAYANAR